MFSFMELIYWHLTPFRQKQKEEKKEKNNNKETSKISKKLFVLQVMV